LFIFFKCQKKRIFANATINQCERDMKVNNKEAVLVLSNQDMGAGKPGASNGPSAVKDYLIKNGLNCSDCIVINQIFSTSEIQNTYKNAKNIDLIIENAKSLEKSVYAAINASKLPIILSGDHANAIGGLSGLKNANPDKRIGVIWIDAHADLHTPYSTPSGNIHGMPLAALAGIDNSTNGKNEITEKEIYYWNELKKLGILDITPKFDLKDLVFIGIRDAEDEEWDLIESYGIKTFEPEDIRKYEIETVLLKTLDYLKDCDLLYVSFDADSLDPNISTGTGTPSPNGLKNEEAEHLFIELLNHPKLGAFEISEVNPILEQGGEEMARVISNLLAKALRQ
jgi:arginase